MRTVAFAVDALPSALPEHELLDDLLSLDGVLAAEIMSSDALLRLAYDERVTGPLHLRAAIAPLQPRPTRWAPRNVGS